MDSNRLTFTPSIAGVWQYVADAYVTPTNGGGLGNVSFSNVGLGAAQRTGVVMIGWQYNGFDNTANQVTPVNLGILEQQADGTMLLNSSAYVAAPQTSGTHSIIVTDFNGDGKDDIFLPAHNESPFVQMPSTLLLSTPGGSFAKVTLTDALMAHDAQLGSYMGQQVVVTAAYSLQGQTPSSPVYHWNGSTLVFEEGAVRNSSGAVGSSVQLADFDGNGVEELLVGDFLWGPGYPWTPQNDNRIAIFGFDGTDITGNAPIKMFVPWVETHYPDISSQTPHGSHNPRVWVDDFNYDGRPDIVAETTLWNHGNNSWPLMLQMLQNNGNFDFTDKTAALNPDFEPFTDLLDYEMQLVDLDASGINSYLSGRAAPREFDGTHYVGLDDRQSNWLLVNDGTGRLHVALHDEYVAIGQQVLAYAASIYHDPSTLYVETYGGTPRLHGYLTDAGLLNFVAEVPTFKMVNGINHSTSSVLVNVPVEIDLRTDYTDVIAINDRNGSGRMRTFAGNDSVHDANGAATAHIDLGLGIDTAFYSHAAGSYGVARTTASITVTGNGLSDTLANVERLRFTDANLALDLDGHAGTVARILGAVFGPASVDNAAYVGIGLQYADAGMSAAALMELALGAALGAGASNAQVVTRLYTNVVGSAPSAGDLASFVGQIEAGHFTQVSLGLLAADTALNAANVGLTGLAAAGLHYL
jgi:hypothetical protein